MPAIFTPYASYRAQVATGAVTTIVAGTSTAGHLLALRNPTSATPVFRFRSFEAEFLLTTAFGAAQEVGFDLSVVRSYTAAHAGATALDFTGGTGKTVANYGASTLTGRIADAGALTAGTHTFDTNAIARASVWCGAVGASLNRFYDLTSNEVGGVLIKADEGLVARNSILMGATGVGRWLFTFEYDEGLLTVS